MKELNEELNEQLVLDQPSKEIQLESLKMVYEARKNSLQFLAERSFTATLQVVTLNVVALGGLIASKLTLLLYAKVLGTVTLIVFNFIVAQYLYFKDKNYQKLKEHVLIIETRLIKNASLLDMITLKADKKYSTWSGTGLFIIAIFITCICTVLGLWRSLVVVAP